jgi:hypothetical protein
VSPIARVSTPHLSSAIRISLFVVPLWRAPCHGMVEIRRTPGEQSGPDAIRAPSLDRRNSLSPPSASRRHPVWLRATPCSARMHPHVRGVNLPRLRIRLSQCVSRPRRKTSHRNRLRSSRPSMTNDPFRFHLLYIKYRLHVVRMWHIFRTKGVPPSSSSLCLCCGSARQHWRHERIRQPLCNAFVLA